MFRVLGVYNFGIDQQKSNLYWFEKYIVEVMAIFQSVLVIFSLINLPRPLSKGIVPLMTGPCKVEKHTVDLKTIFIQTTMEAPPGVPVVSKKIFKINLDFFFFFFGARIEPKLQ